MGRASSLETLKKRSDYLRLRGGLRIATEAFVIEAKRREPGPIDKPRFGFTVTRRLGKAVVRNRIRRRLKEAVRLSLAAASPDIDHVIVARAPAENLSFDGLVRSLRGAVEAIARKSKEPRPARPEARPRST